VARHIASHPVTVTERDTVPRASRHIRPPIRGGGNVTRDRKCGEGRISARHRHMCVDSQCRALRTIPRGYQPGLAARVTQRVFMPARYQGPPNSRTNPRPSYGLPAASLFPCASRPHNPTARTSHNPLQHNETHRCHHLSADQRERVFARALSRPSALLEGKTRARQRSAKRKTRRSNDPTFHGAADKQPGVGGGGTGTKTPGGIPTSLPATAARSPKFGRPWSGKVGWPVKPAALTQRACWIRQIALAAPGERSGAKTHQRPFLSHGGAYRHE
jgi:hypothetical protein